MPTPLVIAHRGDPSQALENSLSSFRRALSLSVDMIEFDVRKSRDNGLYVMHDRLTGRTADRNIDIERATFATIAGVRLKNGEPVPSLSDVLTLVAGACILNIEVKSKGAGALTVQHLLSSHYKGQVIVSSFLGPEVIAARKALPSLPTAMIFDSFPIRRVPSYAKQGYPLVSLKKTSVSEKLVNACHEQGVKVFVWTVDEEEEMRQFISWGVDGIYSNRPGVVKQVMARSEATGRK